MASARPATYPLPVDPLRADDIAYYGSLTPGERLRLALQMMEDGFAMQRANLRRRHPEATDEEVDELLLAWMCRE